MHGTGSDHGIEQLTEEGASLLDVLCWVQGVLMDVELHGNEDEQVALLTNAVNVQVSQGKLEWCHSSIRGQSQQCKCSHMGGRVCWLGRPLQGIRTVVVRTATEERLRPLCEQRVPALQLRAASTIGAGLQYLLT